jgi:hypothetical protein
MSMIADTSRRYVHKIVRDHGDAEECIAGLERMSQIVTGIVIRKTFVDGPDVLTWFDLHTATTDPLPTVNWRHVENGKITAIRVTFDPRPLTNPAAAGGG